MLKINKKIVLSMIPIIFLSLSLTVFTYAWFTNNQSIETTDIEVRARTSKDIDISTDAINWKSEVTLYDIMNASYTQDRLNQTPKNFQAYSTAGNVNNGLLDMFHGLVSINKDPSSENYRKLMFTTEKIREVDGTSGGFLAFDLYLKNLNDANLYLGKKSYVNYVTDDSGIDNAVRVAFVFEGTTSLDSDPDSIQAIKSDDAIVVIWEANSNKHTEAAILNAKNVYGIDITEDFIDIDYYGVKKEFSTPLLLTSTDEEYFSKMDNNIRTRSDYSSSTLPNYSLFSLPRGISKIRIYAWVEGQDVDCENNAAGSDFKFNFNFTTKK